MTVPVIRLTLAALASGAAALVYQILWVRRLGDALGHGHAAVAVVLATFFAGLGVGARLFGGLAGRVRRPWLLYLGIELLIGAWGLTFPWLSVVAENAYHATVPIDASATVRGLAKALTAALTLLPPCLLLGGTLPVLVRMLPAPVTGAFSLSSGVSVLYGINTIGAAAGCALTTFWLLPEFGVRGASAIAATTNVVAGVLVCGCAVSQAVTRDRPDVVRPPSGVWLLAALTGFVGIGLEIVWTRALSARLSSTVYSFAILLATYLSALGIGGVVAAWIKPTRVRHALTIVLVAIAASAIVSSWLIVEFGQQLRLAAGPNLPDVQRSELLTAAIIMAVPCVCLGASFPLLVTWLRRDDAHAAVDLGRVYLANTTGAVLGAVVVGFLLLPALGLSGSLVLLAAFAVTAGLVVWPDGCGGPRARLTVAVAVVILACTTADLRHWRSGPRDVLLEYREGPAASVAVVDSGSNRLLKVDQTYRLGGRRGRFPQHRQGLVPLALHPQPDDVLMLGLGTGSSAGAVAAFGVRRLDIAEILADVADVTHWFDEVSEGLSHRLERDDRVTIHRIDGRHYVRGTRRRYDLVIGDLFVPWRPGEGAMYTREHFAAVLDVLDADGWFVQWLPLYQMGPDELRTIVATFNDVFPHTAAWWLYFNVTTPTLGLVGSRGEQVFGTAQWSVDSARGVLMSRAGLETLEDAGACVLLDRQGLERLAGDAPVESAFEPRTVFAAAHHQTADSRELAGRNVELLLALTGGEAGGDAGDGRHGAVHHAMRALDAATHRYDSPRALQHWVAAVRLAPDWSWTGSRLEREVQRAFDAGRVDEARAAADALDGHWRGHWILARVFEMEGDRQRALASARRALALNGARDEVREFVRRLDR